MKSPEHDFPPTRMLVSIVASYNVLGLPKDGNSLDLRPDIVTVLEKGDIVCMRETWYSKQDLDILNNLHPNFSGTGVSTIPTTTMG